MILCSLYFIATLSIFLCTRHPPTSHIVQCTVIACSIDHIERLSIYSMSNNCICWWHCGNWSKWVGHERKIPQCPVRNREIGLVINEEKTLHLYISKWQKTLSESTDEKYHKMLRDWKTFPFQCTKSVIGWNIICRYILPSWK